MAGHPPPLDPRARYRVFDLENGQAGHIWGEDLSLVDAMRLKETVIGAGKSRFAVVRSMDGEQERIAALPPHESQYPNEMPLRFLRDVGTIAYVYVYWKTEGGCDGLSSLYHSAEVELARSDKLEDKDLGGPEESAPIDAVPTTCDRCHAPRPDNETERKIFHRPLRTDPSGQVVLEPGPGDCYYISHAVTCCSWDNCDGRHLVVVCPDGCDWDTSSRANNCTKKDDKLHRCWVVHGDPSIGGLPTIDKGGLTCAAGAGSILTSRYHGRLASGVLYKL